MCSWNQNVIDKNLERIKTRLIHSEDEKEFDYLMSVAEIYENMEKLMNQVIEKEGDNYIYPPPFSRYKIIDVSDNDLYHMNTVARVSSFLTEFNFEYYDCFDNLAKNGLISLHKNEDTENISTHFIDPVNKTCFIHISSDNEEYELIKQFGYVYQSMFNNKEYDESSILFIDAFPEYLQMTMKSFFDRFTKEEVVLEMDKKINDIFMQLMELNKQDPVDIEKVKQLAYREGSYNMALSMYLNNDVEKEFSNIDEFIARNSKGTKSIVLWNLANVNSEGVNQYKEHILAKRKIEVQQKKE